MAKFDTDPALRAAATSPDLASELLAGAIAVGQVHRPNPELIGGYMANESSEPPTAHMNNEGEA